VTQPSVISQAVYDAITQHPFAKWLGIEVVDVQLGMGSCQMKLTPETASAHGLPHGGVIFTLADTALALASNSYGETAVALDVTISFCRPAPLGSVVIATATEENRTKRTGLYSIVVVSENGKLIASAKGTVFLTGQSVLGETDQKG